MSNNEPITEFRYELKEFFQYSMGGNFHDATYIIIDPPSAILGRFTSILFNEYNKSQPEFFKSLKTMDVDVKAEQEKSKNDKPEETEEADASIAYLISMGGGDLNKCYEALREILINKTMKPCRINGECPMTTDLYNKLSIYDLNRILSGYISNFL